MNKLEFFLILQQIFLKYAKYSLAKCTVHVMLKVIPMLTTSVTANNIRRKNNAVRLRTIKWYNATNFMRLRKLKNSAKLFSPFELVTTLFTKP